MDLRAASRTAIDRLEGLTVWVRLLLGMVVSWGLGTAAFALVFFGAVVTTGCFISCDTPRPEFGIPLLVAGAMVAAVTLWLLLWSASPDAARRVGRADVARLGATFALGLAGLAVAETPGFLLAMLGAAAMWRARRPAHHPGKDRAPTVQTIDHRTDQDRVS